MRLRGVREIRQRFSELPGGEQGNPALLANLRMREILLDRAIGPA